MTAGPYGIAWDVSGDIHPSFRTLYSQKAGDAASRLILANYVARILDTPPGSLPDAPSRGYSLIRLILHEVDQDTLDAEASQMEEQISLDERVVSADIDLSQEVSAGGITLVINATIEADFDGPFQFTIRASEAAVEVVL
jgi:hypothetical protein